MKITSFKKSASRFKQTALLICLLVWNPLTYAQTQADESLAGIQSLIGDYTDKHDGFSQARDGLLEIIQNDNLYFELLRGEEQRYLDAGETARALAVSAQLIKYGFNLQDRQIELDLNNKLIPIYALDANEASRLYAIYQNAWFGDTQTAQAVIAEHYQLMKNNYNAVKQVYDQASAERVLLAQKAGDQAPPDGIESLADLSFETEQAAIYNKQRQEYYQDRLSHTDGLNAGWGMNASVKVLNKRANNYDQMAQTYEYLNQMVGASYAQLAQQYSQTGDNQAISDYYTNRSAPNAALATQFRQIATGIRDQAAGIKSLGASFDIHLDDVDLVAQFANAAKTNELLAATFANMSEPEYWQALYQQVKTNIELHIEENLAESSKFEALLVAAQEFESEYKRVVNDENGIQHFTDLEQAPQPIQPTAPTLSTVPNQGSEGYYVGSIAGAIEVGNSGQPTWSTKIDLPPGVRGVAPQLSLSISGTGAASLSGGSSAISRCGSSIIDDGINKPVDFSFNDHFCMGGQPLVLVKGQYGYPGSEYRTQIDSFEKIIANGTAGNGPASFTVQSRSGSILYYGESEQTRIRVLGETTISRWQLDRLHDISGNAIFNVYENVSSNASMPEVLLTELRYGGKELSSANLTVKITYETRPDKTSGYQYGKKVQSTQRIKQITSAAADKVKRQYTLSYEQGEASGASRVASIQECAGNQASSPCYRPSYFTYTPETSGWSSVAISQPDALQDNSGNSRGVMADINNDGYTDWITAVTDKTGNTTRQTWLGGSSGWSLNAAYALPEVLFDYSSNPEGLPISQLTDVDADGLVDLVAAYHSDSININKIWRNTGHGFALTNNNLPSPLFSLNGAGQPTGYGRLADLNGDALPDILVATRNARNDVYQTAWLNTSNNGQISWAVAAGFTPPEILLDYATNPLGDSRGELLDINSDGLADLVISIKTSNATDQKVYLNTGNGWEINNNYILPVPLNDYTANDKGLVNAQLADINGDGLIDVWQAIKRADDSLLQAAWINDGVKFIAAPEYTPPWYSIHNRTDGFTNIHGSHMDLDGDNKPEYVIFYRGIQNNIALNIWRHNGEAWVGARDELADRLPNIPFYQHFTSQNSIELIHFADLNNDLRPEAFVSLYGVSNGQVIYSSPSIATGEQPGMLVEAINGLKVATRLEYGLSTDPQLYTPSAKPSVYPDIANNSPKVLIKTLRKMDGLFHPDNISSNPTGEGWYAINHQYGGYRSHLHHGSLGFASRQVSDNRTTNIITTQFNQTWPYIGRPVSSQSYLGAHLMAQSLTEYDQLSLNSGKTIYPYTSKVTSHRYEQGQHVATSIKTFEFDEYANQVLERTQDSNSSNQTAEKITQQTFINNTTSWILGLPSQSLVTLKASGAPDIIHRVQASYNEKGFLKTKTIEPGHAQSVQNTYTYDGFGNITQALVISGGQTRKSTTSYTADGRFPHIKTNPLGHSGSVEFSSTSGKVLRKTDVNGITNETVYNAFDIVIKEQTKRTNSPGAREIALPYWCESSTQPACPQTAMYFVGALDDQGESPQTVYFDSYGREILKKSTGWDNKPVYQGTQYDPMGRKVAASKPGFDLDSLSWTRNEFDLRDRVVKRTSPRGDSVNYTYTSTSNSVTNALGQTTTVTNNLQGKPISSVDANGSTTTYSYNAAGDLLTTIDSDANLIELSYDLFGRKIAMNDPDMGQWTYEYDGFGNMLKQTDAKGQTTSMEYDILGRLLKRTEAEGVTQWVYDSALLGAAGQAKGQLDYVIAPDGYRRSHFYDEYARPIKEQTTIKGESYTTERGYYRASDKVDWVKYPSGLVTRQEQDANGFPSKLSSVDLGIYTGYFDAAGKYNDLYFKAREIENDNKIALDHHKAEYDKYTQLSEPDLAAIQEIYDQAQEINQKITNTAKLINDNSKLAQKYYDAYRVAALSSQENSKRAQSYQRKAKDKLNAANYHAGRAGYHSNWYDRHWKALISTLARVCSNANAVVKGAQCSPKKGASKDDAKNAEKWVPIHVSELDFNSNQVKNYQRRYSDNIRKYQSLNKQANGYINSAQRDANLADSKLRLMRRYETIAKQHQARYDQEIAAYEAKAGVWKERSKADTVCITRLGEDEDSEHCLVERGEAQLAEDAYFASDVYQQQTSHRNEYERIVTLMNEAVEAAKTQGELVSDLEEDVLDSSQIYWETLEVAADGQIKSARFGNGVTSDWNYDALGRATYIKANTDNTELQNMFFQYDALGNLNERRDNVNDITETFSYDNLNRLTQSQLSGQGASLYQLVGQENQSFSYDALGNLTYKSDVGDFIYGKGIDQGAGVHALVSTSGAINADFSYDANGNQISGHDRQVSYSSFNKPVEINKSGALNKFTYGPNRQMTTQYQSVGDKVVETHYIGNLFEQTTKDGVTESVHHLNVAGHTIAVLKTTPNLAVKSTHYLHQDHLNSVVMITDNKGEVVEKNHYDAFGKKRLAIIDPNAQPLAAGFLPITDRSFTGHRYLPAQELIHMKGRVYDPTFGRFISADPHIQSPLNSQSLNRYSYVMNNPLSFTDPSGYFLSGLKKAFKKFRKLIKKIIKKVIARIMKVINIVISMIPIKPIRDFVQKFWQPIALVVVAVYFPTMLTFVQNAFAIFNAAASYAGGGSLTKILANVAISMGIPNMQGLGASINGAINGINTVVSNVMGFLGDVGSAIGGAGLMGVAITSGLTSGVTSKLFGGSFSKGFKAGFKSAVVNAAFKKVENTIKDFRASREIRANAMMGDNVVMKSHAEIRRILEDGQLMADNSGGPVNPFRDSEYTGNPDPGLEGVYPESYLIPVGKTGNWIYRGKEFVFSKNLRFAPFGNRTAHPIGRYPHYHRRVLNIDGTVKPGQGIGRHRPFESKSTDKGIMDHF